MAGKDGLPHFCCVSWLLLDRRSGHEMDRFPGFLSMADDLLRLLTITDRNTVVRHGVASR